jgi:hypothetical protein
MLRAYILSIIIRYRHGIFQAEIKQSECLAAKYKEKKLMQFTHLSWQEVAGQKDVLAGLHVPMVYENVPASLPNWEYHVLSVDSREAQLPDETVLNALGEEGWLLISTVEQRVAENDWCIRYYFVRQK